jgi:hypothetical protein
MVSSLPCAAGERAEDVDAKTAATPPAIIDEPKLANVVALRPESWKESHSSRDVIAETPKVDLLCTKNCERQTIDWSY